MYFVKLKPFLTKKCSIFTKIDSLKLSGPLSPKGLELRNRPDKLLMVKVTVPRSKIKGI